MAKTPKIETPPEPDTDEPEAEPIRSIDEDDFVRDWHDDIPHEAAGGSYGATVRDRWADIVFGFADGQHRGGDWVFTFAGGKFIGAVLTAPPADQPAEAEAAA